MQSCPTPWGDNQFILFLDFFHGEDVMQLVKKHKILGGAAVITLAASLFLVPVALAQPPYFDDVPPGHMFYDQINWIYENGITSGCSVTPPLYCPDTAVSRGQMAVFMYRLAGNGPGGAIVDADTLDGMDSTDFQLDFYIVTRDDLPDCLDGYMCTATAACEGDDMITGGGHSMGAYETGDLAPGALIRHSQPVYTYGWDVSIYSLPGGDPSVAWSVYAICADTAP
jgi:hypothetical protein